MSLSICLIVSSVITTYFLGSISFAYIFSKYKGIDLRKVGSGNLGASNVYRSMGVYYAVLVFLLDAVKGFLPVFLSIKYAPSLYYLHIMLGLVAILGHSLSVFVSFKGGKGAATGLGVLAGIQPIVCLIIFSVSISLILITRYVAPVTIFSAVLSPILLYSFGSPSIYVYAVACISCFIIWRHRLNIFRLLAGKENKV